MSSREGWAAAVGARYRLKNKRVVLITGYHVAFDMQTQTTFGLLIVCLEKTEANYDPAKHDADSQWGMRPAEAGEEDSRAVLFYDEHGNLDQPARPRPALGARDFIARDFIPASEAAGYALAEHIPGKGNY